MNPGLPHGLYRRVQGLHDGLYGLPEDQQERLDAMQAVEQELSGLQDAKVRVPVCWSGTMYADGGCNCRGLMEKDEWQNLGFKAEPGKEQPAASTGSTENGPSSPSK